MDALIKTCALVQLYFLIVPLDTHEASGLAARALRWATLLILIGRCLGWW